MEYRFTVTITDEQKKALDKLKKKEFYNKSQSEMIRQIIALGIQAKAKPQT